MNKATKITITAALLSAALGSVAHANLASVSCTGYNVSFDDEIALQLQVEAGSQLAYEDHVCDITAASVPFVDGFKAVNLDLAMAGEDTRVIYFVNDPDEE